MSVRNGRKVLGLTWDERENIVAGIVVAGVLVLALMFVGAVLTRKWPNNDFGGYWDFTLITSIVLAIPIVGGPVLAVFIDRHEHRPVPVQAVKPPPRT